MELVALVTAAALAVGASWRRAEPAPAAVIEQASLTRPSSGSGPVPLGPDARDIGSYDGWVDHPGYACTPQGILATFREAERGYPQRQCDLIDDLIEADCHLRNLFEQREQAVSGKPWVVQSDGQDDDAELGAQILGEALRRLPMIQVIQHMLTVNRYGWSAVEVDWGVVEIQGRPWIVPVWLTPVPPRRFRIDPNTDQLRLYTSSQRPQGDELRADKWIILRRSGTWVARSGLMRTGAWPAMGKRFGFRDWLVYSQRFGLPMPLASYDPESTDDNEIEVATEIVRKIGSDGGAVKPKSITVDMLEATKGDPNDKTHGGLIAHCNAEMSKLVNGSTLSNDNSNSGGGASYGLGEVHDSVRWDNVLFDAELAQEGVRTQCFVPFMRFNNLRGKAPLMKVQVVRDLEPKGRTEIAVKLKNELGIEVSTSQLRQELGFREPSGDGDAAPGAPKPAPAAPAAPAKEAA